MILPFTKHSCTKPFIIRYAILPCAEVALPFSNQFHTQFSLFMNKMEALDFIGLREPLTEENIQHKYTERFNYYHMLHANAPNKVIEKIQQQNLEKLTQARKLLLQEIALRKTEFDKRFGNGLPEEKKETPQPKEKEPVAWLIVHTENRKPETFPLYEGVNFIGRKKKDDGSHCVVLEDDPFVSRTHAFIKAKEVLGELQLALYDGDGSKPSANGVYINGREERVHQQSALSENDTIQIGTTKLVVKIRKDKGSLSGEVNDVLKTGFIRTVDIKK